MTMNYYNSIEEALEGAFFDGSSGEEWRLVPDWYGLRSGQYMVSDWGRVINLRSGHILTPSPNGCGYMHVSVMHAYGGVYPEPVHALVAATYIGQRPEGAVIRHLDGRPTDNTASNLCYGCRAENAQDALLQRRCPQQMDPEAVQAIRRMDAAGMPVRMIAERIGCSTPAVYNILAGRRWGWLS
ncbi:MAG: HNH endonuclease [Solobacterium sp.]|nr:HNH endonuclease [Solobacterium sp.]